MRKTPVDQWTTLKQRYEIGDALRKEFKDSIEAAKMVQEHPFLSEFRFIGGRDLLRLNRIPRFQDYRTNLHSFDRASKKVVVSYRWLSPSHPDPEGRQLRLLQRHAHPDALYWVDFACLPQPPMTAGDETVLRESLERLTTLLYESEMLVLRHYGDCYLQRAWCFFEILAGHTVTKGRLGYALQEDAMVDTVVSESTSVVEHAIASGLPDNLAVTEPKDLPIIQRLVEVTRVYFELNTIMHYMSLGSVVSDGRVFSFGEDPYFLLATHDFTAVLLWVFRKAREHNLPISLLAQDEHSDNYFVELARREAFAQSVDPRMFPRKVTRDQGGMAWFMMRSHTPLDESQRSAHNLFLLLTAMIK